MDPDATLAQIRTAMHKHTALMEEGSADADAKDLEVLREMAESVDALDNWVTRGGFLPKEWTKTW